MGNNGVVHKFRHTSHSSNVVKINIGESVAEASVILFIRFSLVQGVKTRFLSLSICPPHRRMFKIIQMTKISTEK